MRIDVPKYEFKSNLAIRVVEATDFSQHLISVCEIIAFEYSVDGWVVGRTCKSIVDKSCSSVCVPKSIIFGGLEGCFEDISYHTCDD